MTSRFVCFIEVFFPQTVLYSDLLRYFDQKHNILYNNETKNTISCSYAHPNKMIYNDGLGTIWRSFCGLSGNLPKSEF